MSERNFCLEKECSKCCNPVKIWRKKNVANRIEIPKDTEGKDLWVATGEEWAPLESVDTDRVDIYNCKNFDEKTGLCKDYENRPEICKTTNCVKKDSELSAEEQYQQAQNQKYIVTKKKV